MPLGTHVCGREKDRGHVEPKGTFTLKLNDDGREAKLEDGCQLDQNHKAHGCTLNHQQD